MGAPRKYTARSFDRAVERYFAGITRRVELTEKKDSGRRDNMGHVVWEEVPVVNSLGERAVVTQYIVPPSVGGLCEALGIHRSTWAEYCDAEKHPEFSDTVARARGRMRAWNEEQLLTRPGKDVKGIIFNLENNYGYREQQSVEVTGGVEEYLRTLAQRGEGQEF